MEISSENSKVMVAGCQEQIKEAQIRITVEGKDLEQVSNFTYLRANIGNDGRSEKEVRIRIAKATSALARLEKIWKARNIHIRNKLRLMRAIVAATLLYTCESWTLTKGDERRLAAFEMKAYRRLLGVSWKDRKTNEWVMGKVTRQCVKVQPFNEVIRERKFRYSGHVVR